MRDTLLSSDDYATYANAGTLSTDETDQLDVLLAAASQAIADWTSRDFLVEEAVDTITYQYDGAGILEFNDASAVTAVAIEDGATLPATTYVLHQQNGMFTWVELPDTLGALPISPEMGFTYNLDRLASRFPAQLVNIDITATFGWAEVPNTIAMAAYWTVYDWIKRPDSDLTGEAIASFSRQWAQTTADSGPALPSRVRDLLQNYRRDPYALG